MIWKINSFYQTYLPAEDYSELLSLFVAEEQERAGIEIQIICNYVVWQLIAQQLKKNDQIEFFNKQRDLYEEEGLMSWLIETSPDIEMGIKEVLQRTIRTIMKEIKAHDFS